jgi:chromosome segregation ATPase
MKKFQQNLFVVLAVTLCGLCAYQWLQQSQQRNAIDTLNHLVFQKNSDIQYATNSIATLNQQVEQMDATLSAVKADDATNAALVLSQKSEITRLQFLGAGLTNQIIQCQQAVDTLETRLKEAYAGIDRQNGAISNLVAQRDEFVKKYNDSVKDRNDVVTKYNELAKQIEKLQSGGGNHDNP